MFHLSYQYYSYANEEKREMLHTASMKGDEESHLTVPGNKSKNWNEVKYRRVIIRRQKRERSARSTRNKYESNSITLVFPRPWNLQLSLVITSAQIISILTRNHVFSTTFCRDNLYIYSSKHVFLLKSPKRHHKGIKIQLILGLWWQLGLEFPLLKCNTMWPHCLVMAIPVATI